MTSEAGEELAHELLRQVKLAHALRSRITELAPAGIDGAAFSVLMTLVKCGPRRQGELAESTHLDPSTVSRYVGQLVRHGLAERHPDPSDGRAVRIGASPAGQDLGATAMRRRRELLERVVEGWSQDDVHRLVELLRRLNDELERHKDVPVPATPTTPSSGPL